jgi:YesN/AraC family two-component response regulator
MIFYESSRFGDTEPFGYSINENMKFGLHLHRCYELIYVFGGSITVTINNSVFEIAENCAAIILSNHIHSYDTKDYSKVFLCIFSPETVKVFDSMIAGKTAKNPVINCCDAFQELINSIQKTSIDDILNIKSYLYRLSAIINKNVNFVEQDKSNFDLSYLILQYVQDNFIQDISLKDIALRFNYDYHYLSRYFNHRVGVSFKVFVNSHRINFCVEQLINCEMSISDIALNSGFNNVRCFNRCNT